MCIPDAVSTMIRTLNVFFSLLWRSLSFQKFTSIETTSLNISAGATAPCLRGGDCLSRLRASHERCFRSLEASSYLHFSKVFLHFLYIWVYQLLVKSLDVLLDVDRDIGPVIQSFLAQIREHPEWPQLTIYHHITNLLLLSKMNH